MSSTASSRLSSARVNYCSAIFPRGVPLASKTRPKSAMAANRAATLTRQLLAYGRKQILQPETSISIQVIASMEGMFLPSHGR
jgi:hypothetical protein